MHRRFACWLIVPVLLACAGCAGHQAAALQAARHLVSPDAAVDAAALDPALRYLRVTTNGKAALLVLGYMDQDDQGRPVEVWYSADHEVIRLQAGRLVGAAGVPVEWRQVQLSASLPPWDGVGSGQRFERRRDEMPGYRIGLVDRVSVSPVAAPRSTELLGEDPAALRWFEETTEGGQAYPARYALRIAPQGLLPVYGEQCLGPRFCLTWQAWPPARSSANQRGVSVHQGASAAQGLAAAVGRSAAGAGADLTRTARSATAVAAS